MSNKLHKYIQLRLTVTLLLIEYRFVFSKESWGQKTNDLITLWVNALFLQHRHDDRYGAGMPVKSVDDKVVVVQVAQGLAGIVFIVVARLLSIF